MSSISANTANKSRQKSTFDHTVKQRVRVICLTLYFLATTLFICRASEENRSWGENAGHVRAHPETQRLGEADIPMSISAVERTMDARDTVSVSSLGNPQSEPELTILSSVPTHLPTILERPNASKVVGLLPVGPRNTGKSVLVNLAAILSVYWNKEQLEELDGWYDAKYSGSPDRCNPFLNEEETHREALPTILQTQLSRFVSAESLHNMLQIDHRRRFLRPMHEELRAHLRREAHIDDTQSGVLLLPTSRFARYSFSSFKEGLSMFSWVDVLYADERQGRPIWQLVMGNIQGWEQSPATGEKRQLNLTEQIKNRIYPDAHDPSLDDEEALTQLLVRRHCSTHILFQLPIQALLRDDDSLSCLEIREAIRYASDNSSLPIFLVLSYASNPEGEPPYNVNQVAELLGRMRVRVDNQHIFFFEFGGMLDLRRRDIHSLQQHNQWLALGEGNIDWISQYFSAEDAVARAEALGAITPRLPQLANALQVRLAKNLAMLHQLLKRIYILSNQEGVQHRHPRKEASVLLGPTLEEGMRISQAVEEAPKVVVYKTTGALNGEALSISHLHFIRLFKRSIENNGTEVLSYEATLQHHAKELTQDILFDPERDIEEDIRGSYLWQPKKAVKKSSKDGMIVWEHGTLKTIVHPGFWLFFNLGRQERIETKVSKIRDFEAESVAAHNTLNALREARHEPWLEEQVAWLVLNTDLCVGEVEDKQVHMDQRARLLEARTRNTCELVGRLTGRHCTPEQLKRKSFVVPREGYQWELREVGIINEEHAEIQQTYWVYPREIDRGKFQRYLDRNRL